MEWKPFTLSEIADIGSGRDIYEAERIDGDTPYVTAGTRNNGIGYFVGNMNDTLTSDVIVLNRNGAVGNAFYHPYRVLVGNDCRTVRLYEDVGADCKRFVARIISEQRACFSYSRKLGTARAKKMRIMLPVTDDGKPDWDYMSSSSKDKREALLARYRQYAEGRVSQLECVDIPSLDEVEWAPFTIDDVFTISPGKRLEKRNMVDGNRPFIGASDSNNGVTAFVGNDNESADSNVLGINYNGSICEAFYHPYTCVFSDDVKRLHLKDAVDSEPLLLFLGMVIRQQKCKDEYAYKFNEQRMRRQTIMLPVTDEGKPDYAYMEQYAKNMMLRKYQQYLDYLDVQADADARYQKGANQ